MSALRRWALLGLALALAGAGCAGHTPQFEDQMMVFGGVRPLAVAGRTHMDKNLELDGGVGWEAAASVPFFGAEALFALTHLPMRERGTGRDVDLYWFDAVGTERRRFTADDRGSPLYLRYGLGWSFLYMDPEDGHRTGGVGVCGRVGLGSCFGEHAGIELFGDVHGWLGRDAEDSHAAWAAAVGIQVFVAF